MPYNCTKQHFERNRKHLQLLVKSIGQKYRLKEDFFIQIKYVSITNYTILRANILIKLELFYLTDTHLYNQYSTILNVFYSNDLYKFFFLFVNYNKTLPLQNQNRSRVKTQLMLSNRERLMTPYVNESIIDMTQHRRSIVKTRN